MDKEEFLTEDVLADKIYDRAVIRKLLSHVLRYKTSGLLSVFIVLITTVLFLLCPYLFGYAIDHGISKGDTALLYKTAFAILGIETLRLLLVVVQSYNIQAIGQKVMLDIRMELFRHVQSLPVSFFDKNPVGRVVTRLTNDIAAIGELFFRGCYRGNRRHLHHHWDICGHDNAQLEACHHHPFRLPHNRDNCPLVRKTHEDFVP